MILSASAAERDAFAKRLIEDRASLLSLGKVRGLLAGRVPEEDVEGRAVELLDAAVLKRLEAGETVVLVIEGLDPADRERYLRAASRLKRPRHAILIEAGRDQVADEDRPVLNELRRALDAGELGAEGFQTALRLGGSTSSELKRILFRPPPRED
jgi:predicted kinase